MANTGTRLETKAIHAGEPRPRIGGAVAMPIFQSANFEYAGESTYDAIRYLRLSNTPSQVALHEKVAALEGGEAALATASGMAAISTALLTALLPGGHLLIQSSVYGGTHDFVTRDFGDLGLTYDFIDADDPDSWAAALTPVTRAIYVESMTNPLLQVADLPAVSRFAKSHGLVSLIDTDWSSFTIDVGDDDLAARVRNAMQSERGRPSNIGRRLRDLVSVVGLVPLAATEATQTWTGWDPDESPAPDGCFSMRSLADDLVAADQLAPADREGFVSTVEHAARRDRFTMSLTMYGVAAARPTG